MNRAAEQLTGWTLDEVWSATARCTTSCTTPTRTAGRSRWRNARSIAPSRRQPGAWRGGFRPQGRAFLSGRLHGQPDPGRRGQHHRHDHRGPRYQRGKGRGRAPTPADQRAESPGEKHPGHGQSIAAQTFRGQTDQAARAVFDARMAALSTAHNVLVEDNWESASLRSVVERALAPHLLAEVDVNRFVLNGPDARLHPRSLCNSGHGAARADDQRRQIRGSVGPEGGGRGDVVPAGLGRWPRAG